MSNYKKSAKDIAFEKERNQFKKEIKALKFELENKDKVINAQKNELEEMKTEYYQLKDWVERLLEYTQLSEDEMKKIIDKEKQSVEFLDKVNSMSNLFSKYMGFNY